MAGKEISGEALAMITAIFLIGIGAVQVFLGYTVSRSVALTANGIDCIGDGFVSFIVWVGLRYIRRPADHKFHYGYYKFETVASVASAGVMVALAAYIVHRSYLQVVDPHEVKLAMTGAVVASIAGSGALTLGYIKYKKAKTSMMGSARLEAFNTIKDGASSFLAVTALILAGFGYTIADAIVGFIIAGIIITIGFAAVKEAGYILVDACDLECTDNQGVVRSILRKRKEVLGFQVRMRRTGPVFMGDIIVELDRTMTIEDADDLRRSLMAEIEKAVPDVEHLSFNMVPHIHDHEKGNIKKGGASNEEE